MRKYHWKPKSPNTKSEKQQKSTEINKGKKKTEQNKEKHENENNIITQKKRDIFTGDYSIVVMAPQWSDNNLRSRIQKLISDNGGKTISRTTKQCFLFVVDHSIAIEKVSATLKIASQEVK